MAEATALAEPNQTSFRRSILRLARRGRRIKDVLSTRRCRLRPMFTGRKLPGVERALGSALL